MVALKIHSHFVRQRSGRQVAVSGHIGSNVKQQFLGTILGLYTLEGLLATVNLLNNNSKIYLAILLPSVTHGV